MTDASQNPASPAHDKIIDAAMMLSTEQPWSSVSVRDIVEAADVPLSDFVANFSGKQDVLSAFARRIDGIVMAAETDWDSEETPRDRLFDIMMRRFDALSPYKGAIKALMREARRNPSLAMGGGCQLSRSMQWMLEAAGISNSGPLACTRKSALSLAYLAVLRTWLQDDSVDQATTMASLDAQLRRLEELAQTVQRPFSRGGFNPFRARQKGWASGGEATDAAV